MKLQNKWQQKVAAVILLLATHALLAIPYIFSIRRLLTVLVFHPAEMLQNLTSLGVVHPQRCVMVALFTSHTSLFEPLQKVEILAMQLRELST